MWNALEVFKALRILLNGAISRPVSILIPIDALDDVSNHSRFKQFSLFHQLRKNHWIETIKFRAGISASRAEWKMYLRAYQKNTNKKKLHTPNKSEHVWIDPMLVINLNHAAKKSRAGIFQMQWNSFSSYSFVFYFYLYFFRSFWKLK